MNPSYLLMLLLEFFLFHGFSSVEAQDSAFKIQQGSEREVPSERGLPATKENHYTVLKGDTLAGIAQKLLGDASLWKQLMDMNAQLIPDPKQLRPGVILRLQSQDSILDAAGQKSVMDSQDSTHALGTQSPLDRSDEWKRLPKQSWESEPLQVPHTVDSSGFDRTSKIVRAQPLALDLQAIPASDEIPFLGVIFGANAESQYLSVGDWVYIQADEKLTIGETYAITDEPYDLKSSDFDHSGYSYWILGNVNILGVQGKIFIGRIVMARQPILRGTHLIPLPGRFGAFSAVPGSKDLSGQIAFDPRFSSAAAAQFMEVFINRGEEDGVRPGMFFRAYSHEDPSNLSRVSDADFMVDADLLVTQVTSSFCSAMILQSLRPIVEGTRVQLVKDLAALKNRELDLYEQKRLVPEDLESLDHSQKSLQPHEARILEELEAWSGNPNLKVHSVQPKKIQTLKKWVDDPIPLPIPGGMGEWVDYGKWVANPLPLPIPVEMKQPHSSSVPTDFGPSWMPPETTAFPIQPVVPRTVNPVNRPIQDAQGTSNTRVPGDTSKAAVSTIGRSMDHRSIFPSGGVAAAPPAMSSTGENLRQKSLNLSSAPGVDIPPSVPSVLSDVPPPPVVLDLGDPL